MPSLDVTETHFVDRVGLSSIPLDMQEIASASDSSGSGGSSNHFDAIAAVRPIGSTPGLLESIAWKIGVEVAGPMADSVDRDARFPHEAVAALRAHRMLSALMPVKQGGLGASIGDVVQAVRALAFHCSATALVFAMHSIEIAGLLRHGRTPEFEQLMEEIAADQLLVANANSEIGIGGEAGRSGCAVEERDGQQYLEKDTLAVSYGEHADLIVSIARRSVESSDTDQVLIMFRKSDVTLTELSGWNTMGLRGTCSKSFHLSAPVASEMIFPVPFSTVANQGGGQLRQLILSAVWVGIAESATARAHARVRKEARRSIGVTTPSALRLSNMSMSLQQARSLLTSMALWYESVEATPALEDIEFVAGLRMLKVSSSRLAAEIATDAMTICGMEGFRRGGPFSVDRHVRDAHGGLIMVGNDRYVEMNAQLFRTSVQP